jgi:hypothetical protein
MVPCLRERGRDRDCRHNDGGCEKLYSDHLFLRKSHQAMDILGQFGA